MVQNVEVFFARTQVFLKKSGKNFVVIPDPIATTRSFVNRTCGMCRFLSPNHVVLTAVGSMPEVLILAHNIGLQAEISIQ